MSPIQITQLEEMKRRLCELEGIRLISPEDLGIVAARRLLRQRISELERERT